MEQSKKKLIVSILGVFILLILLGGVTYAFFNYARKGPANTVGVGRIYFYMDQTTINLSDAFPIDRVNIGTDTKNVGTLTINIEGDTDYIGGIEYLITTEDAHINTSEGKIVPISLDMAISNGLGTNNANYFTARESMDTTMYKRLSGDGIVGNQQLLVGYIKPNTTSGTIEGIDGSITIKAFFDNDKIAISDTYDGTESYEMGTEETWVDGRVVISTEEWSALRNAGISFKIKVEAREGIWVDEPIYNMLKMNAVMDNIRSTNVSSSTGIDFSKISGDTDSDGVLDNGEGLYIRRGTESDAYPIVYYRGDVDNNVYFAGHCWQIIRTTETGGTKLIYNGENTGTADEPACENTEGTARQITLNVGGTDKNTFQFSGNNLANSPAYNGYTYNSPVYRVTNRNYATGSKFGNNVTWNGTNYTITDVSNTLDANHHYTCGTANATTCSSIRYYSAYITATGFRNYFTLTNGKKIEDVVRESRENGITESNAKAMVEQWYEENIDSTNDAKIEDTVYCNNRGIYNLGSLNPNGESVSSDFMYSGQKRLNVDYNPSTKCLRPQDAFTKESSNGNGLLDYSVGLITIDEIMMAGGKSQTTNTNFYLNIEVDYWSTSPCTFASVGIAVESGISSLGKLTIFGVSNNAGLRPVISLKLGTSFEDGDGTGASPYIVK